MGQLPLLEAVRLLVESSERRLLALLKVQAEQSDKLLREFEKREDERSRLLVDRLSQQWALGRRSLASSLERVLASRTAGQLSALSSGDAALESRDVDGRASAGGSEASMRDPIFKKKALEVIREAIRASATMWPSGTQLEAACASLNPPPMDLHNGTRRMSRILFELRKLRHAGVVVMLDLIREDLGCSDDRELEDLEERPRSAPDGRRIPPKRMAELVMDRMKELGSASPKATYEYVVEMCISCAESRGEHADERQRLFALYCRRYGLERDRTDRSCSLSAAENDQAHRI